MTMSLKQNGASINGQFCLRQGSCTPVKGTVTAGRAVNLRGKLSDSAGGTFTFSLRLNQARNTLSGTGRFIVPSQQGRNRTDTLKAKVMVSRM